MHVLRTPEIRFANLPGYPFEPHYMTVRGAGEPLRMHYLDEGDPSAPPVLLLHGEPTWSYLYRHMIPLLLAAGKRVIASDHIGFGRSDKPATIADYTYARHVGWCSDLMERLDLRSAVLFCQDWGGPIGLSLLAASPQRFAGVVAANTILPTAQQPPIGEVEGWPGEVIEAWMETARSAPELNIGQIVQSVTDGKLSSSEVAAYDAPFPDETYKAGARAFPQVIPIHPDDPGAQHNRGVWRFLERFEKPFATAFGDADPVTAAWADVFKTRVPGAAQAPHTTVSGGHFIQEEAATELVDVILQI